MIHYSFEATIVINLSNPAFVCGFIATLVRERLSTKTCVYPPTAAGASSLLDALSTASSAPDLDLNTPTSYVTELFPRCATLKPRSTTSGNESGEKNWLAFENARPTMIQLGRHTSQNDDTTNPI